METAMLILAVAAAGLACPAMMWWQRRRGRDAACCVPVAHASRTGERDAAPQLDELRRRRTDIEGRIAELESHASVGDKP